MTIERPYIFDKTPDRAERLVVYPETPTISHYLKGYVVQRLGGIKNQKNEIKYWEYDLFKQSLWVGLMVYPGDRFPYLSHYYIGSERKDRTLHGIRFTRKSRYAQYYLFGLPSGTVDRELKNEPPLDWQVLETAKSIDYSKAETRLCKDPSSGDLSFAYRLVPAPGGPLAQVSLTEAFDEDSTIELNPSFKLDNQRFREIDLQAKNLIYDDKSTIENAVTFCDNLQITFSPYFPL